MSSWIPSRRSSWRVALCLLTLGVVALSVPATAGDEPGDTELATVLEDVPGTVVEVGNFGFGLVPDADPGTRYAPIEPLAERFHQDGLRVVFSGEVGDPDEGGGRGRRWGTPLRVTAIEVLDDAVPDPD